MILKTINFHIYTSFYGGTYISLKLNTIFPETEGSHNMKNISRHSVLTIKMITLHNNVVCVVHLAHVYNKEFKN
jgi:hypothetical protein